MVDRYPIEVEAEVRSYLFGGGQRVDLAVDSIESPIKLVNIPGILWFKKRQRRMILPLIRRSKLWLPSIRETIEDE